MFRVVVSLCCPSLTWQLTKTAAGWKDFVASEQQKKTSPAIVMVEVYSKASVRRSVVKMPNPWNAKKNKKHQNYIRSARYP